MKRNLMCLLMVVLCLACACGLAADKDHTFKKAEYRVNLGSEKEDFFTMSCYLMDGVDDMLWMEMHDWCDVMNFLYGEQNNDPKYSLTLATEGNKVTLERENGYLMEMDFDADTITFNDYNGFMHDSTDSSLLDMLSTSGYSSTGEAEMFERVAVSSFDRYGDVKVLELEPYGIEMVAKDGFYVPLQTLNDFLIAPHLLMNFLFNGEELFLVTSNMMGSEYSGYTELGERYYSVKPRQRSKELAEYGYSELCMMFDHLYGLKEVHDISSFDQLFWQIGYDEPLRALDSQDADTALSTFIEYYLDDVHSTFINKSWMTGPEFKDTAYGPSREKSDNSDKRLKKMREAVWGDTFHYYQEVGNTAYITFDEFDYEGPSAYYDINNMDDMPNDTVGLIIYAHDAIYRKDSPIENVVMDLSINGGGAVDAAIFAMAWYLGEAPLSMKDISTGALSNLLYHADTNLDRKFDISDTVMDKKLYCIISPSSFSCGNLVPAAFKSSGVVTMLGRTSGGGSCSVQPASTAWGTMFNYSSPRRLSFLKNGSFYDIDQGVEPDFVINDMSKIYDRQALTDYINHLF